MAQWPIIDCLFPMNIMIHSPKNLMSFMLQIIVVLLLNLFQHHYLLNHANFAMTTVLLITKKLKMLPTLMTRKKTMMTHYHTTQ